jgi:hypothetical protein
MIKKNENAEEEMRLELRTTMQTFLSEHEYIDFEIDNEMAKKLFYRAYYLTHLRAEADFDYNTGDLEQSIVPEQPTRIYKQFLILYKALKSLGEEYPDFKILEIIDKLIESSANQIRMLGLKYLIKLKEAGVNEIMNRNFAVDLGVGERTIYRQCNVLWNLGILNKKTEYNEYYGKPIKHMWGLKDGWDKKYGIYK